MRDRCSIRYRLWQCVRALAPVLALAIGMQASAQESSQETAPAALKPSYRIGVENIMHLPYYGMCDEGYCGFARVLLDTFAADEQISLTYISLPIPRLHRALIDGLIDAKFPANPTWAPSLKEDAQVLYSAPVVTFIDGYLSLAGKTGVPETVGTMRGFTISLDGLSSTPRLFEANAEGDLYNLLLRGRVEAVYTNISVMKAYLRREGLPLSAVEFRPDLPYRRSEYFLSTIKESALIKRFDDWLAANEVRIDTIKANYAISPIE